MNEYLAKTSQHLEFSNERVSLTLENLWIKVHRQLAMIKHERSTFIFTE
jgi:hypothetical protein